MRERNQLAAGFSLALSLPWPGRLLVGKSAVRSLACACAARSARPRMTPVGWHDGARGAALTRRAHARGARLGRLSSGKPGLGFVSAGDWLACAARSLGGAWGTAACAARSLEWLGDPRLALRARRGGLGIRGLRFALAGAASLALGGEAQAHAGHRGNVAEGLAVVGG